MKLHRNAKLSVKGRELLVERVEDAGWSLRTAAEAAGVSERTARKWLARYRSGGLVGLPDRSSAPCLVANRTDERRVEVIAALRRLRMTGAEIAECLDMALSTVSGILTRLGMGKLGRIGLEPAQRYKRARPGELIHIDVKKLGRIARPGHAVLGGQPARAASGYHRKRHQLGWEFVHVAIDDATRLAYVEVLADERASTAIAFLHRAVAHFASYGITVERLITDNGNAYRSTIHLDRLPRARHPPPPHPPLPTPDQRQSRTVHPHHARRLGPTARSTATATSATPRSPAGWTSTIAADHTAPSATSHPSPAYTS
jgi:transposase